MSRGLLAVAVVLLSIVASVGIASADPTANAMAHVYMNIDPNISVQAVDSNISAGTLQTGDRSVPITFRIDANTEAVSMSALVTKLYKGDDPRNTEVTPIPVNLSAKVIMQPDNANPINGGSNEASYIGDGSVTTSKGTFAGSLTEQIIFESSQDGHFSQNVEITPTWTNEDNEKPTGQYSGYVVLYSAVVESIPGSIPGSTPGQ